MEIHTTIKNFAEKTKHMPPDMIIRVIIDDAKPAKKGKWAKIAENISTNSPLSKEAGDALRDASKNFRENFL